MRIPIIAGNWKMNNTISEGRQLIEDIKALELNSDVEAVVCVPFTFLSEAKKLVKDTNIKLGAQNMHYENQGAFTGEISPYMLKEIGVDYVIIGHSERRQYFNETDESVNGKIKKALEVGIKPILCVGESLEERENSIHERVVKNQVLKGLVGLEAEDLKDLVIAYEPIWAIGTGKTASSDDANKMLSFIRGVVKEEFGPIAEEVRLQYGGSVKPSNVSELMDKSDIDGALVGGASLKAEDFAALVNF